MLPSKITKYNLHEMAKQCHIHFHKFLLRYLKHALCRLLRVCLLSVKAHPRRSTIFLTSDIVLCEDDRASGNIRYDIPGRKDLRCCCCSSNTMFPIPILDPKTAF